MARVQVDVWLCDVCKFPWLVEGDVKPKVCPNCNSKKWNNASPSQARPILLKKKA